MDSKKIAYHRQYFREYYGNDYIPSQGTDRILETINKYNQGGAWLDLGGGTNTYFWSIAFDSISQITMIDIDREAFFVLNEVRKNSFQEGCYGYAFNKFKREPDVIYSRPVEFIAGDLLKKNIGHLVSGKYDTITQFGLWGLLDTADIYLEKMQDAITHLNENGVLIGANWVFSEELSRKRGYNNYYLSETLIVDYCLKSGLDVLYSEMCNIENDKNYRKVLIYAIKNRQE